MDEQRRAVVLDAQAMRRVALLVEDPWRFAVLPAVAAAAVALVISVLTGGGIIAPVLSGLWHGALTFGLTGAAGTMARSRKPSA